jgi:hypothetical protein
MDIYIQVFLISALLGGVWLASRIGRITPGEIAPSILLLGGWVGPIPCLDIMLCNDHLKYIITFVISTITLIILLKL